MGGEEGREGEWEGRREGGREGGREGEREGGWEGGWEWRVRGRGGREGEREGEWKHRVCIITMKERETRPKPPPKGPVPPYIELLPLMWLLDPLILMNESPLYLSVWRKH